MFNGDGGGFWLKSSETTYCSLKMPPPLSVGAAAGDRQAGEGDGFAFANHEDAAETVAVDGQGVAPGPVRVRSVAMLGRVAARVMVPDTLN